MAEAKTETVKVRILAHQRVTYSQVVEMSREEFEELDALMDENDDETLASMVDDWIDKRDVYDAEEMEDVEVSLAVEAR